MGVIDVDARKPCEMGAGVSPVRPVKAVTNIQRAPVAPHLYDCVKLMFVRDGSAILTGAFDGRAVRAGEVIVLSAETLCGYEPEGPVTMTSIFVDRDYAIDQLFWQYADLLSDRWEARDFADELYTKPAQILRLGERQLQRLTPWLDELVALSAEGLPPERFHRMQALLFAVLDVVTPHMATTPIRQSRVQRNAIRRRFAPVRAEARTVARLLREEPARRWHLADLAALVHLSTAQMSRVFTKAYGQTPVAYLATVRVEALTRLLRETDLPVGKIMRQVGWNSRGHASAKFRQIVGITPSQYRRQNREPRRAAA